ncbi:type IV secretory system conjugative DNA transfer family protein [Roseobacter litoralis]|uniref:type IV secretory system conjugative DNA transfer family protein n=1 Tax=Roseobacter litoralis TaxID=42443 RepID=UPI001C30ED17|nr:type IV secretory system conjugative DNA transfer family protein [Roseobacter litoralis]
MALRMSAELGRRGIKFALWLRAVRGDASKGDAAWLSPKEAREAGLDKRRPDARFSGILGKTALWLWTETTHLIIGPAGSAKSVACVVLILFSTRSSCLVNDTKRELYEMTAWFRKHFLRQKIVLLDPLSPNTDCVNPLDFAFELFKEHNKRLLIFARDMAEQLYPEPPSEGPNKYFRVGSRGQIITIIVSVVVALPQAQRNLSSVYRALMDEMFLNDLLMQAAQCTLYNGEIMAMAEKLHRAAFGDDKEANNYENFRVGAMQALDPYGPGNVLAYITSKSTFCFSELKSPQFRTTCFLAVDFSAQVALGPWAGLMQWYAADRLVRFRNNVPVTFVLDEFCNSPFRKLPETLTLLRSYGVKCIMVTQDLEDILRVYGKEALATIMSESFIKQFLGGVRSQTTLEWISKALGGFTANSSSFSLGDEGPRESISRAREPLMHPDQIRRMDTDLQIIFYGNLKPILAKKVPVFAIWPWRWLVGINTMYGNKRFLLPVQIRIFWNWSRVTWRGRMRRPSNGLGWKVAWYLIQGLVPPKGVIMLAPLAVVILLAGFPYLRVSYAFSGSFSGTQYFSSCTYFGPLPFTIYESQCPMVVFLKNW